MTADRLIDKCRSILNDQRYGQPGLLVGLMAAAGLGTLAATAADVSLPAAAVVGIATTASNLLASLGAAAFQKLAGEGPLPTPDEVRPILEDPENKKKIYEAMLAKDLDHGIAEAFGCLPPDLADMAWKKYLEYIDAHRDFLARQSTAYTRIFRIITQRRFSVYQTTSELHDLYDHWLPINLIRRPELDPIIEHLESNRVRKLVLLGRPLTGKTVLAAQVALAWLSKPGRTVAFLGSRPQSDDKESLAALDENLDLLICDVGYTQAEPLTPEEIDRFKELPGRVIVCQRIGQPIFELKERQLLDHLHAGSGGGYQDWRPGPDTPPPANRRAVVSLGEIDREMARELFSKTIRTLFPTGRLTLTDEARDVFHEGMKTFPHEESVSLLGLARAFLTYAHQKFGEGGFIDENAARKILVEVGLAQPSAPDRNLDEILRKLFIDILDNEQIKVLRLMARWRHYSGTPFLPKAALYAGYLALHDPPRDLREDPTPLERLQSSRVLTFNPPSDTYTIWHGKQLELIPDEYSPREKKEWMLRSLASLEKLVTLIKIDGLARSMCLADFCAGILQTGYKVRSLIPILRLVYTEHQNLVRHASREEREIYLSVLAATANNLGNLLRELDECPEARKLYEDALEIYRGLAKENLQAYLPFVAATANNQGILLRDLGEHTTARTLYEEALQVYRGLFKENPEAYLPFVAMTANNLGDLLRELGARTEARKLLGEALEIRKRLFKENPQAYLKDYAAVCNNIGILLLQTAEWAEAAEAVQAAVFYHVVLYPSAPPIFGPRLNSSLKLASRLCQNPAFQDQRETWLADLKANLTKVVGEAGANELLGLIS
ncbi:MAG: tetratricopeptide repeat protein [Thermodesulfobacteriota bacterium]